jgi:hypothetical protein
LMEVILSVPDGGYFERTWWRLFWAYLMEVILSVPDGGYLERTWWRLSWAYLMEVKYTPWALHLISTSLLKFHDNYQRWEFHWYSR